jgi:hypothetical protein
MPNVGRTKTNEPTTMKQLIAGAALLVVFAGVLAGEANPGKRTLTCSGPTTIVLPLGRVDPRWPKEPWRFACVPKAVEVSVVSLQSQADSSQWTSLASTLSATVKDEGPLRIELTEVCSGSSGKAAILEGHLKWGGLAIGLRNCEVREYQALRLQIQVVQ